MIAVHFQTKPTIGTHCMHTPLSTLTFFTYKQPPQNTSSPLHLCIFGALHFPPPCFPSSHPSLMTMITMPNCLSPSPSMNKYPSLWRQKTRWRAITESRSSVPPPPSPLPPQSQGRTGSGFRWNRHTYLREKARMHDVSLENADDPSSRCAGWAKFNSPIQPVTTLLHSNRCHELTSLINGEKAYAKKISE